MLQTVPRKIIPSSNGAGTRYHVRIQTGRSPKSALYNPNERVNIAFMNTDGLVLWHQFVPALEKIRGDRGDEDEVEFHAEDIGVISQVMVAPEGCTWGIQQLEVHTPFQETTFTHPKDGDGCLFVSPEYQQPMDQAKYEKGMSAYNDMKNDILLRTIILVVLGSAALATLQEQDVVLPFALGGGAGVLYQRMLQDEVDAVGQKQFWNVYILLNTLVLRVGILIAGMYALHQQDGFNTDTFIMSLVGFFLNKLALLSVVRSKSDPPSSS